MVSAVNFTSPLSNDSQSSHSDTASTIVELMMIQDAAGKVVSFQWQAAEIHQVEPEALVGRCLEASFAPIGFSFATPKDYESHLERIQRVLAYQTPEQFSGLFRCGERTLQFDLVISPVMLPNGTASLVVVAGQQAEALGDSLPDLATTALSLGEIPNRYQKLLIQFAWNLRRTLDLPTIWQQAVDGLGSALGVSHCVLCSYGFSQSRVQVVAEYRQEPVESLLETHFSLNEDSDLREALETLKPIRAVPQLDEIEQFIHSEFPTIAEQASFGIAQLGSCGIQTPKEPKTRLLMATYYQEKPNGIIILHEWERDRIWTQAELEFVQEVADRVGAAIAHATRFTESQALTIELQRVNHNLVQKHRELEEARQQAEEASRLKSEFLANTSHELRTPLNGMIGFLKLVIDGMAEDPEEQREFIEEAHRSAMHLLEIINDVLDIAKIEAGKMLIELSPVKLDELLTHVENMTRTQVRQKQLSFEIEKQPTHDEIILFGNYQRLLQVMLNLVGNAIKFTHEGGITISAEVIKKRVVIQNQELPGTVKVRVADTGIGVSLDKQDKLFQSFSQVDGSLTRQYGGTGLGLAISQKLVEAMGGVVNFYSMGEGLGSTVTFTVPLYQEPVMITG